MRMKLVCVVFTVGVVLLTGGAAGAACCTAPDNGTGTVDLPVPQCPYDHPDEPLLILDGLPAGTTIEITGPLRDFINIVATPGGSLGGEAITFDAVLFMNMTGTGSLVGFNRNIALPVSGEMHVGPRSPGDAVQSFDTEMVQLQGELFGDPDFDQLRFTAGTDFGLPSPGHTTLTRLGPPGSNFQVDSFFDVSYRIDFVGAPGSVLEQSAGSTTATARFDNCEDRYSGQDCYHVACGRSRYDFAVDPIPADFFGPGSDPFDGIIRLQGGNPDGPDTVVGRLTDFNVPSPGSTDTVPIEIVSLSLVSCEPIIVTYNGGQNPESWDVQITPSPSLPPPGQTTLTKTHQNGGTFESFFDIWTTIQFTRTGDPTSSRTKDDGANQLSNPDPYDWQDTSPKPNPPCDGNGFYPVGQDPMVVQSENGKLLLELMPTHPPSPCFALDTAEQWRSALGTEIVPFDDAQWSDYMDQWQRYRADGNDYPDNSFVPPELYVWDGNDCTCPNDPWPSTPGLVMAWGDDQMADGNYGSGWRRRYPNDPDLSNVTINITVLPPCGISAVSFGMQDISGNIRAWYWNVAAAAGPGTLQCGVTTAITINTALGGIAAATPAPAGYMNNPLFDITQVQDLLVDENYTWVGGAQPVPPPGQLVARMWNYWHDLIITPNAVVKPDNPLKWTQPPVEIKPRIFLGWDELSVLDYPPLMADDWLCEDRRPVTDIHWWGSFLGWEKPDRPPLMPIAFQLGIWTDVPMDSADPESFSHPGELVWMKICYDYQWNFAGFDKDPRNTDSTVDPTTGTVFQPAAKDACFQFYCLLDPSDWFYQKPRQSGRGTVYWLSIAAVYDPDIGDPEFPWGWKTRPHHFNDDAVRIFQLEDGSWPPNIGSIFLSGEPVEYPEKLSWDLAFELTTNEPEREVPVLDIDLSGIIDWKDFAYFANQWLTVWP